MGWNGSDAATSAHNHLKINRPVKPAKSNTLFYAIIGGLVVAALIVLVALITAQDDSQATAVDKKTGTPRIKNAVKTEAPKKIEVVEPSVKKVDKDALKMKTKTPEERNEIRLQKFKEKEFDMTVPSNRVFRTGTEQILSWIFTTELGDLPPPLPKIPDSEKAHFAKILLRDNPLTENDSEFSAAAKEMVQLAKKEMVEYIKKGGSPEEFLDYYRGELMQAYEMRKAVQQSIQKILKEEPEIALEYLNDVNKDLESRGIKKIKLHPKQLKHFGIEPLNQGEEK
jgi:hypothetical protein